ncbi:hypothetical protein MZM54_00930 [[Brevibacterium] frigoritolerans]|nr:hypothetical protein [Peribacillus frigoritolerans]
MNKKRLDYINVTQAFFLCPWIPAKIKIPQFSYWEIFTSEIWGPLVSAKGFSLLDKLFNITIRREETNYFIILLNKNIFQAF